MTMTQSAHPQSVAPPQLAGVLPVFQTPYYDDESIDFDTLGREIDWLYKHGVQGITMAMVSEVLRLSDSERREVAGQACRFSAGRGAVVISVGAECSKLAEDFARHAQSVGAAAVMAAPPIATRLGGDELLRYYRRIIEAVNLPVIVQDASGYVGAPMPITTQAALLDEYGPDRVMFKPEAAPIGPKLTELREATGGRAKVFEGSGGIALVDSYRRSIVGAMPGAEIADSIVALWRALEAGDDRRIYQLSQPIGALVALQSGLDGFLAVEKHLLVQRGVFKTARVRGPVSFTLDPETLAEVDRLFAQVQKATRGER